MPKEQLQLYDALDEPKLALEGLARQLRYTATTRIAQDNPSYWAYCVGTAELLEDRSQSSAIEASRFLIDVFRERREAGGHELNYRGATELLFREHQKQFLWPNQSDEMSPYPRAKHRQPETWRLLPQRLLLDDTNPNIESNREEYVRDLRERDVQSNVASRYIAHYLVMHFLAPRLGHAPRMLDLGTSDMLGPIKLKVPESPFQKLTIQGVGEVLASKRSVSRTLNGAVSDRRPIGDGVGVDIVERDTATRRWIYACTLRGEEWNDSRLRDEWQTLHEWDRQNEQGKRELYFYKGDVTAATDMRRIKQQSPIEQFDMVTMTTMLYQLSPKERASAQRNAARFLAENGVILYQDFCGKDPDDPSRLTFFDDWTQPFSYRTLVSPAEAPAELYEFARWRTGRCNEVELGQDFLRLVKEV